MKKRYSCLAAILLASVCYFGARQPTLSDAEMAALAKRFQFQKASLPEVPDHPAYKMVRQVHPSLERISAWVSSLGAAATLADLDGDGLPNDVISVDPRTDLVTVAPVPGTGDRYQPFALNSPFWSHNSYDLSALAPMGTLAGDFNEDGLMDVLVYFWGRTPILYLRNPVSSVKGLPCRPLRQPNSSSPGNAGIRIRRCKRTLMGTATWISSSAITILTARGFSTRKPRHPESARRQIQSA